jgi:hypothetical protein
MGDMEWIALAHNKERWRALVNAVMYLRVPKNVRNLTTCFSRRILLHGVS